MSRTTLGFFLPPLTKEERDTVIAALIKITTKNKQLAAFQELVQRCEAVVNDKMGDALDERLFFQINEQIANQVNDWALLHPEARELANQQVYWVKFVQLGEKSYTFNYSPAILEIVRGYSPVLGTRPSEFDVGDPELCHQINKHILNQTDTIVDNLPKNILKAEEDVLKTFNHELCDKIGQGFSDLPGLQYDQSDFLIRFAKAFIAASKE